MQKAIQALGVGPVQLPDPPKSIGGLDKLPGSLALHGKLLFPEISTVWICDPHSPRIIAICQPTLCKHTMKNQNLYGIEREVQELDDQQRLAIRQARSAALLEEFKTWLMGQRRLLISADVTAKALTTRSSAGGP